MIICFLGQDMSRNYSRGIRGRGRGHLSCGVRVDQGTESDEDHMHTPIGTPSSPSTAYSIVDGLNPLQSFVSIGGHPSPVDPGLDSHSPQTAHINTGRPRPSSSSPTDAVGSSTSTTTARSCGMIQPIGSS